MTDQPKAGAMPGEVGSEGSRVHRVTITYCPRCRWLLRAAWMAQELLTTFERELLEVALRPGEKGVYDVRVGDAVVWSRAVEGRFPELKELKQRVRDTIAPDRGLGHSEGYGSHAGPGIG